MSCDLMTVPEIARELGIPAHRVSYAILSRGIPPHGRVGNARVWRRRELARIRQALLDIEHCRTNPLTVSA